ncbi:MAG: hypothetical protein HYS89_00720 [Candidatus Colwellbacteria bacterium]|nr:hypothetical protein [Candidatus Colwellbacteria bacterium]
MVKKPHIRKLTRMGGGRSLGLVLPADLVRDLNWRERQKVVVKKVGKRIVVEDWPVRE